MVGHPDLPPEAMALQLTALDQTSDGLGGEAKPSGHVLDGERVTISGRPGKPSTPLSASQRQSRYREARRLVSIDVSTTTLAMIAAIRDRTALTTDQVLAHALALLRSKLERASRERQNGGLPRKGKASIPEERQSRKPARHAEKNPESPANTSPGDTPTLPSRRRRRPPPRRSEADVIVSAGHSGQLNLFPEPAPVRPPARSERSSRKNSDGDSLVQNKPVEPSRS